jgi:hypothetical protein
MRNLRAFFTRRNLRTPSILIALTLTMAMLSVNARAQSCAPISNIPIIVNGVVANLNAASVPFCPSDAGWRGVIARDAVVFGLAGTQSAKIFITGTQQGASMSDVFIGVHVEGNPDLDVNDRVLLYFDANNSSSFDEGDFAIRFEVGPLVPRSTGDATPAEECNKGIDVNPNLSMAVPTFFKFTGGVWQLQGSVPAGVTSKVAFDFRSSMPSDAESEIWELEVGLNLAALSGAGITLNAPTQGNAFRMGAKLFVNEIGAAGTTVWRWPTAATTESNPAANTPALDPTVQAANLEQISFGNCGDVVIESLSSEAPRVDGSGFDPNSFRVLQPGDFVGSSVPVGKQTRFHGRLRFQTSPMGLPTAIGAPNAGNAAFNIMPWGTNGAIANVLMRNNIESFNVINTTLNIDFNWPLTQGDYNQAGGAFNSQQSNHACLKLTLNGFPVNINEPGDALQRNLSYITTSTVRENFMVTAERRDDKNQYQVWDGRTQEFIIRARWQNLRPDQECKANASVKDAAKCEKQNKWAYVFPDAGKLGMKHLGRGYYRMVLREGQRVRVPVQITGGTMPFKSQKFTLSPRAGGNVLSPASGEDPLRIPIKPGTVVTIVATGLVDLSSPGSFKPHHAMQTAQAFRRENGPDGFKNSELSKAEFLLNSKFYTPSDYVGALIGSFDGFKTSFVIGSNNSFIVPDGTETLWLAVNDLVGQYADNRGVGFGLNIVIGDPVLLPTRVGLGGNAAIGVPGVVAPGANLPQLQIDAFRRLPTKNRRVNALRPAGYAVYAVYDTHVKEPPRGIKPKGNRRYSH